MRILPASLCAAAIGLALTVAPAQAMPTVHEYELDNGMRILVRPDQRADVVISQLWFPVGSSHERQSMTGISHALEHMMFKGTENRETGEFSRTISREGGRLNAFTGRDYTAYHEQLQADRLEIALELEADRLANIIFDEEEFANELEVVREERRQVVDSNPVRVALERFHALAWHTHPYRNPIIGWPSDLDVMTLDDIRDWYERWYGVNNATLVVVGNVDPDQVRDLAERHFGPLEPREAPEVRELQEVEPLGERRAVVRQPRATPYMVMGWPVPSLSTAEDESESYALSLLSRILDGGRSARFAENVIRGTDIAASAGSSYNAITRLDTMFYVDGRPTPDSDLDQLEETLRAEVQRVIDEGVTSAELDRARIQARADYLYRLDSLFAQGMEIGTLETTGIGWRAMETFDDALDSVAVEDIQAVAERYFRDDRITVVHLLPDNGAAPSRPAETPDPAAEPQPHSH
ncbi:zinc protease [Natronocella acetinitrilica]|uniref:Zinc protease n=1 Tax=Natronocella acetinitrilica TaxID=414046 RepID=A0AAE3KA60_9GAMM|nr:pitrilysin family protein [Natronocella acetinitrilica]MCP1673129.1 zinc protease [Natronocella acetinitrilica]